MILRNVFEWFLNNFEVIYPDQPISDSALLDNFENLKKYADLLKKFNTGIVDIRQVEVSEDKVKSNLSVRDRTNIELVAQRNVQLVVTTHETRLMSHNFFCLDEIWTCENLNDGSSALSSFDMKHVRIDMMMDENYMAGNLGGVPKLKNGNLCKFIVE